MNEDSLSITQSLVEEFINDIPIEVYEDLNTEN